MNTARARLYVDALYTSPYAMSAFVVLKEKGIDFELVPLDLGAREHQAKDYASLSLTQRVPTLVQGDFALSESSAIIEYLEDAFPEVKVFPQDVKQRARARQIQAWLRSDLLALRTQRPTEVVFCGEIRAPLTADVLPAVRKLFDAANTLLADGREHLFGQWSIADADLALMLNRLILNNDDVPPALVTYAQRQWQRPSVQAWVKLPR